MHLVLPPSIEGLAVEIGADRPLPSDRAGWYRQVAGACEVLELTETESGWPLVLLRPGGGRLYGFYELFDRGVAVTVTAPSEADLDSREAALRAWLRAGDIDRRQTEIVALAQLWEER